MCGVAREYAREVIVIPKKIVSKEAKRHRRVMAEIWEDFENNHTRKKSQWDFDMALKVAKRNFEFHKARTATRREFVISVNQIDPRDASVMFKMLKGEDPTEEIWKALGL